MFETEPLILLTIADRGRAFAAIGLSALAKVRERGWPHVTDTERVLVLHTWAASRATGAGPLLANTSFQAPGVYSPHEISPWLPAGLHSRIGSVHRARPTYSRPQGSLDTLVAWRIPHLGCATCYIKIDMFDHEIAEWRLTGGLPCST